jgi:hypothetical protein
MVVDQTTYHYRWDSEHFGGVLFSSDSLSERTANWLGERKEVEVPLNVGSWPRFRFGRWAG